MAHIRLQNASVSFPVFSGGGRSIKQTFLRRATGGRIANESEKLVVIHALSDLCLELVAGERLGLYGHNGSGKTTLLRLFAGVYAPSSGSIETHGRVTSFLDITMGMDPEATGYENIEIRCALLGVPRIKIQDILESVEAHSGLGDFLNLPIRTYSSGMIMRLAFSIAISAPADILLMDEWLSVGDEQFRQSSHALLMTKIKTASILVLASQDRGLLESLCTRILTMDSGRIVEDWRSAPLALELSTSDEV